MAASSGRAHDRDQMRFTPAQGSGDVANPGARQLQEVSEAHGAQRRKPVGVRSPSDHRPHGAVARRDRDRVTAAVGRPPERDPVRVDARERARVSDRRAVLELTTDVQQLPWLTLAGAEVAVVEGQHRVPGGAHPLRVGVEPASFTAPNPWPRTMQAVAVVVGP